MIYLNHQTFILEPIEGTQGHHVVYNEEHDTSLTSLRKKREAEKVNLVNDYAETPLSRGKRGLTKKARKNHLNMKPRTTSPTERKLYVAIALDYSMVKFHQPEQSRYNTMNSIPDLTPKLRDYLISLMEIVDTIYNDDTLENKISISLVDIDPLARQDSESLIIEDDPAQTLQNVAETLDGRISGRRRRSNKLNEFDGQTKRDLTIFLTRREFGPAGYAPVGTICQHDSYTINREEGFSSAFVIAHEVGHVLGMRHDGTDNECDDDPLLGSIMAPIVQAKTHQFQWSRCSNVELKEEINNYECLNKPIEKRFKAPKIGFRAPVVDREKRVTMVEKRVDKPNGLFNYTLDEQCQFAFGPDHYWCNSYNNDKNAPQCQDMWCSSLNNKQFCKSKHSSPLDGTPCRLEPSRGGGKGYCFQTMCVALDSVQQLNIDGRWSEWGEWEGDGQCSAKCDTGTKIRRRTCIGRKNNGRDCEGKDFDYQICNTHPCRNNVIDRRTFMCQRETGNSFMVPKIHQTNPSQCQLSCWDQRNHEVNANIHDLWVDDGTPCSYDRPYSSMCIQGECVAAGCDKETGSRSYTQANKCGICISNGSGQNDDECEHVSESTHKKKFKIRRGRRGTYKTFNITTIPAEAHNTQITVPKILNAEIAFIDTRTNFRYVLTKAFNQEVVGGALVRYNYNLNRRARKTKAMFTITGRLLNDVVIQVGGDPKKSRGRKSVVWMRWEYYIRKVALEQSRQQQGEWEYTGRWTACKSTRTHNRECNGSGKKKQIVQCRVNNKIIKNKNDARRVCGRQPPVREKQCKLSLENCRVPYQWHVRSDWSECSVTCGTDGTEFRDVVCINPKTKNQVPDEKCTTPKPFEVRPCHKPACPPVWIIGGWRECEPHMGKCGDGYNYREVQCKRGNNVIPDVSCHEKKPPTARNCEIKCSDECVQDQSVFCGVMYLKEYCRTDDFRKLCCDTCKKYTPARHDGVELDEELNQRSLSSPMPGRTASRYHTGYTPISPLDQDYEMNNDEEYDVDVDESGTYLPDNRRYRRSVPRTMWTLEKLEELGRELTNS